MPSGCGRVIFVPTVIIGIVGIPRTANTDRVHVIDRYNRRSDIDEQRG